MSFLQINIGTNQNESFVFNVEKITLFESLSKTIKFNWDMLHEDNKLEWLIKDERARIAFIERVEHYSKTERRFFTKKQQKEADEFVKIYERLEDRFFELMDEWFEMTAQNSNRKEYYTIMAKLIQRRAMVADDPSQINWVEKFEQDLKDLSGDVQKYTRERETVGLMSVFKMHINTKKLTVVEYHEMVQAAIDMNSAVDKYAEKRGEKG